MLFVTCICDDVGFQHCLQQLKETVIEDIGTKNQLFPYKKDTALRYHTSHLNPSHHLIASASNRNGNRIGLSICFLPMLGSKTSHQYDLVTAPTFGFAGVVRRRQVSQCLEVLLACLHDIAWRHSCIQFFFWIMDFLLLYISLFVPCLTQLYWSQPSKGGTTKADFVGAPESRHM